MIRLFLLLALMPATLFAQVDRATFSILCETGLGEVPIARGVVIDVDYNRPVEGGYFGLGATCAHVTCNFSKGKKFKIRYTDTDRTVSGCETLVEIRPHDVSIISVWVPAGVNPVPLAPRPSRVPRMTWYLQDKRIDQSVINFYSDISSEIQIVPGDSGSPICDDGGRLVGLASSNWFIGGKPSGNSRATSIDSVYRALGKVARWRY